MVRKRVTQIFPWLLPLRKWQRKKFFYLKMRLDRNRYAKELSESKLPYELFNASFLMINKNSGFDMQYQMNKVHNLKLAAETIDHLMIKPGETFSFWQLVRYADRRKPYKDGLICTDGKISGSYGGGLCQLSNLLFWMFLHIPVELVERHGHTVESFPSAQDELPCGTDATVHEGWLDLKVRNKTEQTFQIVVSFDGDFMCGQILSDHKMKYEYKIYNKWMYHYKENGKIYQAASVDCIKIDKEAGGREEISLYRNCCEIGYALPDEARVEEGRRNEEG